MNFDFGEVLRRTWQITWKNKALWVLGIVFGLFFSLIFLISFVPALLPMFLRNLETGRLPALALGYVLILAFFILLLYPVSVVIQTSITLGVLAADQEQEKLPVLDLIRRSLPFFWRVLGLMLLVSFVMTTLVVIIQLFIALLSVFTFGIGVICAMPLMILLYPAIFLATIWMEQSMNGIIVDGLPVIEAIRQDWQVIRNNLLAVAIMLLVLYLGVGMIAGLGMMPAMLPVFVVPFGFLDGEVNRSVITVALLSEAIFFPLFILVFGWSMIFTKSAWTLTYLRLTRSPKLQPLPQAAAA